MRDFDAQLREQYVQGLAEIEEMYRSLLGLRFDGSKGLWEMQVSLVRYQLSMWDRIRTAERSKQVARSVIANAAAKRSEGWLQSVQDAQVAIRNAAHTTRVARQLLCISRSFGDAIAWLFFKMNPKHLLPLSENQPTSLPSRESLTGLLALAEGLANNGLGFPLIHDITNVLRIGDISFCAADGVPLTIEVKAAPPRRLVDGYSTVATTLAILDTEQRAKLQRLFETMKSSGREDTCAPSRAIGDARAKRQNARMTLAHKLQCAKPGEIVKTKGIPRISPDTTHFQARAHWDELAGVVSKARTDGQAHVVVDGAILYGAVYRKEPLWFPWDDLPDMSWMNALFNNIDWKQLSCVNRDLNALVFALSAQHFTDDPPIRQRPIGLFPLDVETIIDMLYGRLLIVTMMNPGRIIEAMETVGLCGEYSPGLPVGSPASLSGEKVVDLPTGGKAKVRLANLGILISTVLHECLSMAGVIEYLQLMATTAEGQAKARSEGTK